MLNELQNKKFEIVNLVDLNVFDAGSKVGPDLLKKNGLVKKTGLVKILGKGKLEKPIYVKAHLFSKSAERKIREAGGDTEVIKC